MPVGRAMQIVDEQLVHAPVGVVFDIARQVDQWPALLEHYRWVRFRERSEDGGGLVAMSANRPFGLVNWPTWWLSRMSVDARTRRIRFHHVGGLTAGMDVDWSFEAVDGGTHVRLEHVWDGPRWPFIGVVAATAVIGPIFIHGIASRTLAGLARVAESEVGNRESRGTAAPPSSAA